MTASASQVVGYDPLHLFVHCIRLIAISFHAARSGSINGKTTEIFLYCKVRWIPFDIKLWSPPGRQILSAVEGALARIRATIWNATPYHRRIKTQHIHCIFYALPCVVAPRWATRYWLGIQSPHYALHIQYGTLTRLPSAVDTNLHLILTKVAKSLRPRTFLMMNVLGSTESKLWGYIGQWDII